MDLIDLGLIALVGIVCGFVGQLTSNYSRGGIIVNVGIGMIGAAVGTYLARLVNAPDIFNLKFQTTNFPIIYSLIGSVFLVAFVGFLVRPGRH